MPATIRPRLSDRDARADVNVFDSLPRPERYESEWSPLHPGVGFQAQDIWANAAVLEARALLAVTEPGTQANQWVKGLSTDPRLHACCGLSGLAWDCYSCHADALAESLARFVEVA